MARSISSKELAGHLRLAAGHIIGLCPCKSKTDWNEHMAQWFLCQTAIMIVSGNYSESLANMFQAWARRLETEEKLS